MNAGSSAADRRDGFRPTPTWPQNETSDLDLVEGDDFHSSVGKGPDLIGRCKIFSLETRHDERVRREPRSRKVASLGADTQTQTTKVSARGGETISQRLSRNLREARLCTLGIRLSLSEKQSFHVTLCVEARAVAH